MTPLEIEVKFHLPDPDTVRRRIISQNAVSCGISDEINLRFEDAESSLLQKKTLLRLRSAGGASLTYKSPAPRADTQFKVHQELEVTVSDFATTRAILESIGFHIAQRYEKKRETFKLNNTLLCLDTMPYGDFLEIEGDPEAIRQTVDRLELDWSQRILTNYLAIFDTLRHRLNLSFHDVTFKNFHDIHIDFSEFAHLFIASADQR